MYAHVIYMCKHVYRDIFENLLGLPARILASCSADEDNYTPRYSLCYNVILYLLNKDSN